MWGYNGQLAGPEIRVTEGDTVRTTFTNNLAVPTTVHWHGLDVPNAMDGVYPINGAVYPETEFITVREGDRV